MPTIIGNIKKLIRSRLKKKNKQGSGELAEINAVFRFKYTLFKELLAANSELLNILSDMEEKLKGNHIFGGSYIKSQSNRSLLHTFKMVKNLNVLSRGRYQELYQVLDNLNDRIKSIINEKRDHEEVPHVISYRSILKKDADFVGGKNANLGEIRNCLNIPVPEGFAFTTTAFNTFLDANGLKEEIQKRKHLIDPDDSDNVELLNRLSNEISELIMSKPVPMIMMKEIRSACMDVWPDKTDVRVAMRSSAIGEDGELSFAGQYLTILNVTLDGAAEAYKSIIASLYSARSISYRISKGIYDDDLAMAVACIRMVNSVSSGVMYTRHPYNIVDENILINSVWGLGPYAVDGMIIPDTFVVNKKSCTDILTREITTKKVQLVCDEMIDGGVKEIPVPEERQSMPSLTDTQIVEIARYGKALEEHYRCAQDIEWAIAPDGKVMILQSRPLKIKAVKNGVQLKPAPVPGYRIIVDESEIASQGVGSGEAYHVSSEKDLISFPKGAILVAHHSSPEYVVVMKQCSGIITESGSVSGHMAALAREFNVPTIMGLGAQDAVNLIKPGTIITLDGYAGRVYEGAVTELIAAVEKKEAHMKGTPVHECLKRVSELMTPLYLINPRSPDFTPSGCRTLHDIARFCHENSYMEMFNVSDIASKRHGFSFRLDASLPIDLHIIDLGNGIGEKNSKVKGGSSSDKNNLSGKDNSSNMNQTDEGEDEDKRDSSEISDSDSGYSDGSYEEEQETETIINLPSGGKITPEQITSVPFSALLQGMLDKKVNTTEPRPVNFSGLFSVMQQQMLAPGHVGERFGDRSYAIIADKYLNFSSRVGYHYSVVDAYCGETVNKNYITFSFKGGAADDIKRNRRVRAIAMILDEIDFTVDVKEDKVDARLQKYPCSFIRNRLDTLGKLLIFTRQMDMLMTTENSIELVAKNFLAGNYSLQGY